MQRHGRLSTSELWLTGLKDPCGTGACPRPAGPKAEVGRTTRGITRRGESTPSISDLQNLATFGKVFPQMVVVLHIHSRRKASAAGEEKDHHGFGRALDDRTIQKSPRPA